MSENVYRLTLTEAERDWLLAAVECVRIRYGARDEVTKVVCRMVDAKINRLEPIGTDGEVE